VAIISCEGQRLGIGVVLRAVVDDDHLVCRVPSPKPKRVT
jgi:hypothetical protein